MPDAATFDLADHEALLVELPALTATQRAQYREEGYVFLGRVLNHVQLEELREEEARLRHDDPKELTLFRAHLAAHSEPIRRLITTGPQVEIAKEFIGPNVSLWWDQLVTKLPDAASEKSEFPWHQDSSYIQLDPATSITIWIALDDVDERNGCVWIMPASHKRGLLPHQKKSEDSWHLTVPVEGDGIPAVLKAGEAVAFTGLTLHRSKFNHTNHPRRAMFIEYCDANAKFSPDWKPVSQMVGTWVISGAAK